MKRLSHALYTVILTPVEIQPNKKSHSLGMAFFYMIM